MSKQQSLAAKTGTLTMDKLPAVFSAPQAPMVARALAPYITFAHPKRADEWNRISGKFGSVNEGDMFLVEADNVVRLPSAKLGWMCHLQYWGEANPAGELLRTSLEERPKPFKEHVEAVVLVYFDDRIVPANVCFRTTKCPAAKALSDAFAEAQTPQWADKSPDHRETLVCQQVFMRFFGEVTLGPQRTSRTSGLPYRSTQCKVLPTGVAEWRLIKSFIDDPASAKQLQLAADRYESRIADVKAKIK